MKRGIKRQIKYVIAAAILDRLLHDTTVINIKGGKLPV